MTENRIKTGYSGLLNPSIFWGLILIKRLKIVPTKISDLVYLARPSYTNISLKRDPELEWEKNININEIINEILHILVVILKLLSLLTKTPDKRATIPPKAKNISPEMPYKLMYQSPFNFANCESKF